MTNIRKVRVTTFSDFAIIESNVELLYKQSWTIDGVTYICWETKELSNNDYRAVFYTEDKFEKLQKGQQWN